MEIKHEQSAKEFVIEIDGQKAYVEYSIHDDSLDVLHTIVPKSLEGQGIAGTLVKEAYDYAIKEDLRPLATCSYAKVWLMRHPDYIKGEQ